MPKVRAKFTFDTYETQLYHQPTIDPKTGKADYNNTTLVEKRTLKFSPVFHNGDPNHENTKFWEASPSGQLVLGTINPGAWNMFELGKTYYLDLIPAD